MGLLTQFMAYNQVFLGQYCNDALNPIWRRRRGKRMTFKIVLGKYQNIEKISIDTLPTGIGNQQVSSRYLVANL